MPPLVPLPRTPKAQRVVGGIGAGLSGSILNRLLPIAPRQPRAPRGPLGGSGPVKPGGPEGGDAVSSESDKKTTDLASCRRNLNGRRRPLTTAGEGGPTHHCKLWSHRTYQSRKFFLHQHTRSTQDRLNKNPPHRHFRSREGEL